MMFHPHLRAYIKKAIDAFSVIEPQRRQLLKLIAHWVEGALKSNKPVDLIFICTHNSRRSHFAAIWCAVAALQYGFKGIRTWSGGTEATAFHVNAVHAVERTGIVVSILNSTSSGRTSTVDEADGSDTPTTAPTEGNPMYLLQYAPDQAPLTAFSKRFDDPINPQSDFAAVMTCTEADKECPVVPGAAARFNLPFQDPKHSDGSHQEEEVYDRRCKQIATEMMFIFSLVVEYSD